MRRIRRDSLALSEIVGSLMLVLIVVVAATALAVFVQNYQKNVQAEQALAQARSLESLKVLRVAPTLNTTGADSWADLNFTVASLYVNPSTITELTLNNAPVRNFTAWHLDLPTGNWTRDVVGGGGQLTLYPREQVYIEVDAQGGNLTSFYTPSLRFATSSSLNFQILTAYQNVFAGLFIPPSAVAIVQTLQTWNATSMSYTQTPLLDGSNSFQPGNGTIVDWTWNITPGNVTLLGEKQVAAHLNSVSLYTIRLTVTDNEGLEGVDTITYV